MGFADRIKKAREKKHLSQEQLACLLGVTDGTISNYEKGVAYPRCETIKSLCKILEVDPNYLFWDDLSKELQKKITQNSLLGKYNTLNYTGQKKADDYIDDLLKVPEYTLPDDINIAAENQYSAHADDDLDDIEHT